MASENYFSTYPKNLVENATVNIFIGCVKLRSMMRKLGHGLILSVLMLHLMIFSFSCSLFDGWDKMEGQKLSPSVTIKTLQICVKSSLTIFTLQWVL
jgi:hypothetical protein